MNRTGQEYGTPYSVGEAKLALTQLRDVYHRELYGWLVQRVEQLEAHHEAPPKSERLVRLVVEGLAPLVRDGTTSPQRAEQRARNIVQVEPQNCYHLADDRDPCEGFEYCVRCGLYTIDD